jgi:hypothetical protein
MRNLRIIIAGILSAIMVIGLSGCKITSTSPDLNTIVEMRPGEKKLFKVTGPVNTPITKSVWSVQRMGIDSYLKEVSSGSNEYLFVVGSDGEQTNRIVINCTTYIYRLVCECQDYCDCDYKWDTSESQDWEIRIRQDSMPIWQGNYYITNDTDVQILKGYTGITEDLTIDTVALPITGNIENLEDLNTLTVTGGDLCIRYSGHLASLSGLENLASVGGSLNIYGNDALSSLTGLENLTSIDGNLIVGGYVDRGNKALASLTGLENLTSVGGSLDICGNDALISLSGLENITSVSEDLHIGENDNLASLSGLENITSVGRMLYIEGNDVLTNLFGLQNITSVGGSLNVSSNRKLTSLSCLNKVKTVGYLDVCRNSSLAFLGMSELSKVDERFGIYNNSTLCKSLTEELRDQVLAGEGIGGEIHIYGNKDCTMP